MCDFNSDCGKRNVIGFSGHFNSACGKKMFSVLEVTSIQPVIEKKFNTVQYFVDAFGVEDCKGICEMFFHRAPFLFRLFFVRGS